MRDFLSAQVDFPHPIVCLHFIDGAFADDGALVQHCNGPGDLADKFHIVFNHDHRMLF